MLPLCKNCGYQRLNSDLDLDYACPKCAIVYTKVDKYLENKRKKNKEFIENKRKQYEEFREKKQKKEARERVVVKNYFGSQEQANSLFLADSAEMAEVGYYPTTQNWSQGQYGCIAFLVALVLCFFFVGILIFIYMIIVKPGGTLSVTYELKDISETKTCVKCAETIKAAARVCRYCNYEY